MTTHIKKWGNSLAVRLPKELVEQTHLRDGGAVSVKVHDGHVIITPLVKVETLENLLKKVSVKNIHKEVDWGNSIGLEIW